MCSVCASSCPHLAWSAASAPLARSCIVLLACAQYSICRTSINGAHTHVHVSCSQTRDAFTNLLQGQFVAPVLRGRLARCSARAPPLALSLSSIAHLYTRDFRLSPTLLFISHLSPPQTTKRTSPHTTLRALGPRHLQLRRRPLPQGPPARPDHHHGRQVQHHSHHPDPFPERHAGPIPSRCRVLTTGR